MHSLDSPGLMGFTVGDEVAPGQHLGEDSFELDGHIAGPELGPGKDAGAEVSA